ncbi:YciI family protein [Conexibacter sp. SYSU D00693]|uniref:YciI family protein n=1 Tax=Conexibacter sp. SYSU D00693 TaxID=2812560 RepID=UPI00196B66C3|nr:YciI family protein [Conexibacter sp. SYSU D00693]
MERHAYLYRLLPPRPDFAMTMTEEEAGAMGRHAAYFDERLAAGEVHAFGLVMDPKGPWGVALVLADQEDAARAIADADPAIASGTCTYELLAMPRAFVAG